MNTENHHSEPDEKIAQWQANLLPFMKWFLVTCAALFMGFSCWMLLRVENQISLKPPLQLDHVYENLLKDDETQALEAAELISRVQLEQLALDQQYRMEASILKARILIKYIGFLTGFILAIIGAVLILGKIREKESGFDSHSKSMGKVSFRSSSPGLFLVFFGVMLMAIVHLKSDHISSAGGSQYFNQMPEKKSQEPAREWKANGKADEGKEEKPEREEGRNE